jgi:hypothetical protein
MNVESRQPDEGRQVGPDELIESGGDWLRRGLQAYVDDDHRVVLTHVGIALEHFSKAYLASQSPALLVDMRGDFDSLLVQLGMGRHAKAGKRPRTVSGAEALKRARQLLPSLRMVDEASLNEVLEERHGVLHAGRGRGQVPSELVAASLIAITTLMDVLGVEEGERWGPFGQLVGTVVQERAREVEVRVAQKRVVAEARYIALIKSLPDTPLREQVLVARELGFPIVADHIEQVSCPVCKRKAHTAGLVDIEWDYDADGQYRGLQTYSPFLLTCPVCGLELLATEELVAAGLSESWELDEWADPAEDNWDDYEPDEDIARGR